MDKDLRRAQGTLSDAEFKRASARFKRMEKRSLDVARAFLVQPGMFQVDIAERENISRQLVYKHCRKLYDAHCQIVSATRDREQASPGTK